MCDVVLLEVYKVMSDFGVFSKSNTCFSDEVSGNVGRDIDKIADEVINRNKESYEDGDDKKVGGNNGDGYLHETFVPEGQ